MRQATDLKLRSEQSIETATPSTDFDQRPPPAPWGSRLLWSAEKHRLLAAQQVDPGRRATLGQFLTPPPVASFLASLFDLVPGPGTLVRPLPIAGCARQRNHSRSQPSRLTITTHPLCARHSTTSKWQGYGPTSSRVTSRSGPSNELHRFKALFWRSPSTTS